MTQQLSKKEEGSVLILFAISLSMMLAFAGVAIDVGNLYRSSLRAQKAADAGALAAVNRRILNQNESDTRIEENSRLVAMANLDLGGVSNPRSSTHTVAGTGNTDWVAANDHMDITVKEDVDLLLVPYIMDIGSKTKILVQRKAEAVM